MNLAIYCIILKILDNYNSKVDILVKSLVQTHFLISQMKLPLEISNLRPRFLAASSQDKLKSNQAFSREDTTEIVTISSPESYTL